MKKQQMTLNMGFLALVIALLSANVYADTATSSALAEGTGLTQIAGVAQTSSLSVVETDYGASAALAQSGVAYQGIALNGGVAADGVAFSDTAAGGDEDSVGSIGVTGASLQVATINGAVGGVIGQQTGSASVNEDGDLAVAGAQHFDVVGASGLGYHSDSGTGHTNAATGLLGDSAPHS